MRFLLTTTLGLEIESSDDFHKAFTFTQEASEKLRKMGFFVNKQLLQEIKRDIYQQNFWSFFSKCKIDQDRNQANILELPHEVLNLIQEQMEIARVKPQ
jgi:hypothetical protein